MTLKRPKSAAPVALCALSPAAVEHLQSVARRHPRIAGSIEVAREVGAIAVEAVRQVAAGIRQGAQEVAARRAAAPAPMQARRRRASSARRAG